MRWYAFGAVAAGVVLALAYGPSYLGYDAAWALDHDPDAASMATYCAKAYASDAAVNVCRSAMQLHGGIGFTWEHDLHLFFKRAKGSEFTFGDATYNRELVAQLIDL